MNRKRKTSYLLLTAILALGSAAAAADTYDVDSLSRQDSRFKAWVAPFLEELNLTEEQKPKFLAIQKAMPTKWAEFQKMPPHERKPKQRAFYKARQAELKQLLTPEQMAKFREIQARRWKPQSSRDHSKNDIEGTEIKTETEFILLHSVLGYELNATKRALIRTGEPIEPKVLDTSRTIWRLLDSNREVMMTGSPQYLGITFGVQLWEINFSGIRNPGVYRIEVEMRNKEGTNIGVLSTLPFEVQSKLHFTKTFTNIAIHNAEVRRAPPEQGGGYYDCHSPLAEAFSAGPFLVGLINAYTRKHQDLSVEYQTRLIEAVNIAADYLMSLHNESTGRVIDQHPLHGREIHKGIIHTQQALYGLVSYAHLFKEIEPERAKETYKRALKSIECLNRESNGWRPELKVLVYYHLYKHSGDDTFKNLAISALNDQLTDFDLRKIYRDNPGYPYGNERTIPYFEGLHYCVKEFKDHPNHSSWVQKAKSINEQYFQHMLEKSGFHIIPQNAHSIWDNMERVLKGAPWSTQLAALAIDAIYLAEITEDSSLEKIASGALGWITGLNPGLPREMVINPHPGNQSIVPAAFIMNLDAPHAKPWSKWGWRAATLWARGERKDWILAGGEVLEAAPTKPVMSIINGFKIINGRWDYIDDWSCAETWIASDGTYLYAICVYEDYLKGDRSDREPATSGLLERIRLCKSLNGSNPS